MLGLVASYTLDLRNEYIFILFYSLFNIFSYGWLFMQEMKYAPDFHPFQVLSLVALMFIGVNGISCYNKLSSGENIYFASALINDCLYLGVLFLSLQHLLLFSIFFYMEKKHENDNRLKFADRIKASNIDYGSWALRSYIIVWVLRGMSFFVQLGSISTILVNIANYGHLLTLYLLTFAMMKNPRALYKNAHWIIVFIEIALVLNHGMKEQIIRTLVPYCIYLLIMYKAGYQKFSGKMITNIAIIGFFVVGFVFPYVSITRTISNTTGRLWSDISVTEIFNDYIKYINNEGEYADEEEERGAGYLVSRAGSLGCNAWSIYHARREGLEPLYFAYCVSAMIPRVIWRDKPIIVTGAMAYAMVNGDQNWINTRVVEEQATSISLGFIGSCYMCMGLIGSLLYIAFISFFIWFVWDVCRKKMTYNIIMIWAFISFIAVLLKDYEGFQDCGINFLFFNTIYILLSRYFIKMNNSKLIANEI